MPTYSIEIKTPSGPFVVKADSGSSVFFVGANGSGKTRLAVKIEESLGLRAHRISAHRALALNPGVPKISEDLARKGLTTGAAIPSANAGFRGSHRWGSRAATLLLNDFDALVQTLFADHNNKAVLALGRRRTGDTSEPDPTIFERLIAIWESLLPLRKLLVTGDDISVHPAIGPDYNAGEMSDGERAIFYLIGQTLCAPHESALVFDEPELHVHRSIMSQLWDRLESTRPDCAFIFISHDLEFAAARVGKKYTVSGFTFPDTWSIEEVPEDSGFDEEVVTRILGSRRPILFVEGSGKSLDIAVYRNCYPDWTVIPRGSCEDVIHSVVTFRASNKLTRLKCAGIVDIDGRTAAEISTLKGLKVEVLPVSEIENIFAIPSVSRAIGIQESIQNEELTAKLRQIKAEIFSEAQKAECVESTVLRFCRRRIDRALKNVDLSNAKTVDALNRVYGEKTAAVNITDLANELRTKIANAIAEDNLMSLLACFDNKGIFSIVGKHLKGTSGRKSFEDWIVRILGDVKFIGVRDAVKAELPHLTVD